MLAICIIPQLWYDQVVEKYPEWRPRGLFNMKLSYQYRNCPCVDKTISMGKCKKDVTPVHYQWSYIFFCTNPSICHISAVWIPTLINFSIESGSQNTLPGGRLNKRCHLTSIGVPMLKIRCLIFNMGIPYLGKVVFILRRGPADDLGPFLLTWCSLD